MRYPKQKALLVEQLQSNGHTVGFLGDGMNDLPAILQADVGISVENAAEAVKESADVILLKKDLAVLDEGITEGRKRHHHLYCRHQHWRKSCSKSCKRSRPSPCRDDARWLPC